MMRSRKVTMALLALVALSGLAVADAAGRRELDCSGDVDGGWLLVYRWTYVDDDGVRKVRERFDGRRYYTETEAYCGAERLRLTGVLLPTLARYGRDSNVQPDSITPMPHLAAVQAGIQGDERRR